MKSLAELQAIRDRAKMAVNVRENSEAKTRVLVGMATCGIAAGARPVLTAISDEVNKRELHDVLVTQTGCIGICQYEPVVEVLVPGQEKVATKLVSNTFADTVFFTNSGAEALEGDINDAVREQLLMLGLLVACHEPSTPTSVAQVTASSEAKRAQLSGELFYLPRMALPDDAVAEVMLVDVSLADAPAVQLASQQIKPAGQ